MQPSTCAQNNDGPSQKQALKHISNVSVGGQQSQSVGVSPPVTNRAEYVAGRRCVALFDCKADNVDELSFCAGQVIRIVNTDTAEEDWLVPHCFVYP